MTNFFAPYNVIQSRAPTMKDKMPEESEVIMMDINTHTNREWFIAEYGKENK